MPKRAPTTIPDDPDRFEEAIEAFRARVPMTRKEWDKLEEAQREHAFMVSEVATADIVTEVYEAIDKAIADGTTLEAFKETAGKKLEEHWDGEKPGRLETIFRTNVLHAYNTGRHAVMSAPAVRAARPYLRFEGVDDDRQSELCEDIDGTVLAADDPWWGRHTPPLHHQCRSQTVALSEEEAEEEGVTDEPPEAEPAKGFGARPSKEGDDWSPDLDAYPDQIAAELKRRIG